ncbi:MAG: hypothetical protein Q9181_002405 [Wetmoreana brouardii]
MADSTPKSYHTDPNLYLYTSLTAGSSQIITATSRLETILKANRIPFQALDVATNEKARMLWGRRAGKRKLPGLVRMGMLIGDLEEIEEWNEYGELKEKIGVTPLSSTPSAANTPTKAPSSSTNPLTASTSNSPSKLSLSAETPSRTTSSINTDSPMATALRQAAMEAANKAGDAKAKGLAKAGGPSKIPTQTQQKLESSSPTGLLPPSGTTDAATAIASERDAIPSTGGEVDDSLEEETYEGVGSNDPDKKAVVPNSRVTVNVGDDTVAGAQEAKLHDPDAEAVVSGSKGAVESEETAQAIHKTQEQITDDEEDNVSTEASGRNTVENTTKATTAADDARNLPGRKTQDQAAAKAEEAGGLSAMLFFSFFKTLVNHEVTVELKNDISIKGTLKSVDQFLNIKLDDIQVLEEIKYPHLSSVKNVFIRGSVVRYVHLPGAAVDTALLEDATRREAAQQASKAK